MEKFLEIVPVIVATFFMVASLISYGKADENVKKNYSWLGWLIVGILAMLTLLTSTVLILLFDGGR